MKKYAVITSYIDAPDADVALAEAQKLGGIGICKVGQGEYLLGDWGQKGDSVGGVYAGVIRAFNGYKMAAAVVIETEYGPTKFSLLDDLRDKLCGVALGSMVTVTYTARKAGAKMFTVEVRA